MALNLSRVTQAPHDMLQILSSCEPLIFHVACKADAINLIIMQLETYANGLCKSFITHHEIDIHPVYDQCLINIDWKTTNKVQ